jgi:hypothetical protein
MFQFAGALYYGCSACLLRHCVCCSVCGQKFETFHCFSKREALFSASLWCNSPTLARAASFFRFLEHTQWHTTFGNTSLDEGSACRRYLCLITHNTHKRLPWPRRDSNTQSQDPLLRQLGHWDRLAQLSVGTKSMDCSPWNADSCWASQVILISHT